MSHPGVPPRQHTVLVVEDEPVFRASLVQAVCDTDGLHLAGQAADLPEALQLLVSTRPDILLVDIGLPSGSGVALIRYATRTLPLCQSLVVSLFGDEQHVIQCLQAGAVGYLLKGPDDLAVASQIHTLLAGGSPISPVIARRLLARFTTQQPQPSGPPWADSTGDTNAGLSEQEHQVLKYCARGYSYAEIARLMDLSRHTVETYIKRIYRKLQVHSRCEAVFEAHQLGLLSA